MTNNKKGFTLIELLVVIAIIGILSAIGLVSLNGAREKARDSKAKSDLATMRTALALYYDDHNFLYPGTQGNNVADESHVAAGTGATASGVWATGGDIIPAYMGAVNAPATRRYGYLTPSTADSTVFVVYYNLEGSGGTFYYSVTSDGRVTDVADSDAIVPTCTDTATGPPIVPEFCTP